jgi:hypothetical protein
VGFNWLVEKVIFKFSYNMTIVVNEWIPWSLDCHFPWLHIRRHEFCLRIPLQTAEHLWNRSGVLFHGSNSLFLNKYSISQHHHFSTSKFWSSSAPSFPCFTTTVWSKLWWAEWEKWILLYLEEVFIIYIPILYSSNIPSLHHGR